MRYTVQSFLGARVDAGSGGSTGATSVFAVPYKAKVRKVFVINESVSTHATQWVVTFDKQATAGGGATGLAECGTITRPLATSTAGKFYYEVPSTLVTVKEGEEIIANITVLDGTATQNIRPGVELEYIPEDPSNNTNMVAA